MRRVDLLAAVLALSVAPAAQAQPPPAEPISPTPPEEPQTGDQPDASAVVAGFRPGMIVKDPAGRTIGAITRIGETVDSAVAIEVDLDGRRVSLSPAVLSIDPSGAVALSSMTKAEIQAASARARD